MIVKKNGEFSMDREEVIEFSSWLDKNPRERYKRFNEVVQAFLQYKQNLNVDSREFEVSCVS
ncbi:MAG TPA: hypothetical protein VGE40_09765 [Bacilli bacterium]